MSDTTKDLDAEITVTLTVYQARALRISSLLGGPPASDRDPKLEEARHILGRAENAALAREGITTENEVQSREEQA